EIKKMITVSEVKNLDSPGMSDASASAADHCSLYFSPKSDQKSSLSEHREPLITEFRFQND
ncbi:MAG: hypothetical protein PVI62_19620, partial [Desulfobacterales bacterium]